MARTALHQAAVSSGERTQMRIDEGFDVDEADVLLQAGAHVDPQDKWGNTPIGRALFGKDDTIDRVQLLVDHGADPTIENRSAVSALKLARRLQKLAYLTVFENEDPPRDE